MIRADVATEAVGFTASLIVEPGVEIGRERIDVRFADGRREELRLHEYERVYAVPGLYERIVQERLGCRSPAVLAGMLGAAVDECGWKRAAVRVLDIAAGNGVSGEALAAAGLGVSGRYATDIVPVAREAALRDRPGLYERYETLDLLALSGDQRRELAALGCAALSCVAPVGERRSELPPDALAAAAALLADDAVVVYMHDPAGASDIVDARWWRRAASAEATLVARQRYRHRYLADGSPFEMDGVVWRLRRAGA